MEAGMWDRAAESYERAVQLDGASSEARIKLQRARARQARDRVGRAGVLVRRGAFEPALALCYEAVSLDPTSAKVQAAFNDVIEASVAEAYRLVAGGAFEPALAMSTTVLRFAPGHPGALEIDGRVRQTIASRHDARADAFLSAGRRGNALVELTLAQEVLPNPSREARRSSALQGLRDDVRFFVALVPAGSGSDILSVLRRDALTRSIDPRPAIEVTPSAPEGVALGVRIDGSEPVFAFSASKSVAQRSCDYVCGTDTRPNPEHDVAERAVADTERALAGREEDVARAEREVDRHQRDVDEAERELSRLEARADRERERLERCLSAGSAARPPSCNSEKSSSDSAQRDVARARDHLSSPRDRLSSARRGLSSAREQRNRDRQRRDEALASMRNTPRTIEVDRICQSSFPAELHQLVGTVRFELRVVPMGRQRAASPSREGIERVVREQWETWDAVPRRCPRDAKGPPVPAPSESVMRGRLVDEVTSEVRRRVMTAFERTCRGWFDEGVAAESEGRADDAVESYVRVLVAGGGTGEAQAIQHIDRYLKRERGLARLSLLSSL